MKYSVSDATLPNYLWIARRGGGITTCLNAFSEYLYSAKIIEFTGIVKYFEFIPAYTAPDELSKCVAEKTLCQALSQSSFDIQNIGKEKTAIYIIVPDEKTTMHFLVTAFIKQTYEALIHEAQQEEDRKLPVRLNFLLDEFCNLPTIPDMASMISAARSRNMRFFLMAQGMHQIKSKYNEDADTIKGNCDNWVFLTSREYDLLKEISYLCGESFYTDYDGSVKSRSLISVSELQRLKKETGETLILHGRNYPLVTEFTDSDQFKTELANTTIEYNAKVVRPCCPVKVLRVYRK